MPQVNRPVGSNETWLPAFKVFASALGLDPSNVYAAENLMKAILLVKAQEGKTRLLPSQSSLGGAPGPQGLPNTGPIGNVPYKKKFPFTSINLPWISQAPDFMRLGDILSAVTNAKAKLWCKIQHWQEAHVEAGTLVSAQPMWEAIKNSAIETLICGTLKEAAIDRAQRIYREPVKDACGRTLPFRMLSVSQLVEYLRDVNADLDVFEDKMPGHKQGLITLGFMYAGLLAERKALQNTLYGLDQTGTIRDMMQTYEAMTEFGDYVTVQMNASLAHDNGLGKTLSRAFKKIKVPPPEWGMPTPPLKKNPSTAASEH